MCSLLLWGESGRSRGLKAVEQCVVILPKELPDSPGFLTDRACYACLYYEPHVLSFQEAGNVSNPGTQNPLSFPFTPTHVQDLPRSLRKCSIPAVSHLPPGKPLCF